VRAVWSTTPNAFAPPSLKTLFIRVAVAALN
jgi:hypothetical protein